MEKLMGIGDKLHERLADLIVEKENKAVSMLAALELEKFSIPMDAEDQTYYGYGEDEYLAVFGIRRKEFVFVTSEDEVVSTEELSDTVEDLQRIFKYAKRLEDALEDEIKKRTSEWSALLKELQ